MKVTAWEAYRYLVAGGAAGAILARGLRPRLSASSARRIQAGLRRLASPLVAGAALLLALGTQWPPALVLVAVALVLARREGGASPSEIPLGLSRDAWMERILGSFPDDRYGEPRLLGEGGMAGVFRVADRRLQRDVAFKLMDPEVVHDAAMRARFVREGRVMAGLHHPGLPAIHDVADLPIPYIVMSFIEGGTLADHFDQRGPAPPVEVRSWLLQAAEALSHAHGAGIVHRDVKPENLMLDSAGRVWVIDFGIARMASQAAITQVGVVMGTPLFLAPEQVDGQPPSPLNDVYSLAATGFYLMTGEYPYAIEDLVMRRGGARKELPATVDRRLAACLALALDFDPEKRPPSMRAFAEMLAD